MEDAVALQIADPAVVAKVERLARAMGLTKTAVVEQAIDRLASETPGIADPAGRMAALLAQLDRIPDRTDTFDPLEWDPQGLPRRSWCRPLTSRRESFSREPSSWPTRLCAVRPVHLT